MSDTTLGAMGPAEVRQSSGPPRFRNRPRSSWRCGCRGICGVLAAALVVPGIAAAQSAEPGSAPPYLAGNCTSCHGTQGRAPGGMPSLAGLPAAYVVEQMRAFREGTRPATIMHQIAKGYADREVERVADYFARQAPSSGGQK